MFNYFDTSWVDTIEQKLHSVNAPLLETMKMSFELVRDRYPNLGVFTVIMISAFVGFKLYRQHRHSQTRQQAAHRQIEKLTDIASHQAVAFNNQATLLLSFRDSLGKIEQSVTQPGFYVIPERKPPRHRPQN
ncbi:MAG: hypothetical protein AB7V32_06650 [Candidatus Berkiella sp.]